MSTLSIKQETATKQSQHLLLSLAMQQAFHVLQMPVLELAEWLKLEIEQNPVLEIDLSQENDKEPIEEFASQRDLPEYCDRATAEFEKKRRAYQESLLTYPISLYEHLLVQARIAFPYAEDFSRAELLIGHLDERGFLTTPLDQIDPTATPEHLTRLLSTIQTFDPPGVAAVSLQDSLLLQLRLKQKGSSLAYRIVKEHFEDLIHHRLPRICKKLHLSPFALQQLIQTEITPLDIHPGYRFHETYACPIIPDLHLDHREGEWEIQVNHSRMPHFRVVSTYQNCLKENALPKDELFFIRRHLTSGKWLQKIVTRRHNTLHSIAVYLIKRQGLFLSGEQRTLHPMTLQEVAQELGIHESTVARAVSNKYLSCPQGIFSLRSFFTHSITCHNGQKVSNHTLRQMLAQMVEREDKTRPLSDASLACQFKKIGIPCARRTVTKYRKHLQIAPAAHRRQELMSEK